MNQQAVYQSIGYQRHYISVNLRGSTRRDVICVKTLGCNTIRRAKGGGLRREILK
jgi:hypothetical protein